MKVKLLLLAIFLLGGEYVCGQHNCIPEEGDLVEVGYKRVGNTAVYVDSIEIRMKEKKKQLKKLWSCETALTQQQKRKSSVKVFLRKEGFNEWTEVAETKFYKKDIEVKDTEPCTKYEVKLTLQIYKTSETSEFSKTFSVGPYYEMSKEDIAISKYKGDGENYYEKVTQSFRYEDITEDSFTIRWDQFCGLSLSIWATPIPIEDDHGEPYITIVNDFDNPITELVVEALPCKTYQIDLEFYLDSSKSDTDVYQLEMDETVTTDPSLDSVKSKYGKYTYDKVTQHISWNFNSSGLDALDECLDKANFALEMVGTGKELAETNQLDYSVDLSTIIDEEPCSFQIEMIAQYSTQSGNENKVVGFIQDIEKEKIENSIEVDGEYIVVSVDPCEAPGSKVSVGLVEVNREDRGIEGRISMDEFLDTIDVDTDDIKPIAVSGFGDSIQSCVAYQISLTRSSDKELAFIYFPNPPNETTWSKPELDIELEPIHFNVIDKETDGQCPVSKYEVECTDNDDVTSDIEDDDITDLIPDTSYDCRGRIVHNIPGIDSSFTTEWSDVKQLQTPPETTTIIPTIVTTEVVTEPFTTEEPTTFTTDIVSNTDVVPNYYEYTEVNSEETKSDVGDNSPDAVEDNYPDAVVQSNPQDQDDDTEDNEINTAATDFTTVIVIVSTIALLLVVFVSLYVWKFRKVHVKNVQEEDNLAHRASVQPGGAEAGVDMDPSSLTTPNGIETIVEVPEDNEVKKTEYTETKVEITNEVAPIVNPDVETTPKKDEISTSSSDADLSKKPQDESDSKGETKNADISVDSQTEATSPKDEFASPIDSVGVTDTVVSDGVDVEGTSGN